MYSESSTTASSAGLPKTRILLIEDNPGDADLTIEQLQNTDTEIVQMQTLQESLSWLSHEECEAIILDLNLSDSRGLDTLRHIKNAKPNVPAIVVSGLIDNQLRADAARLGAEQVISKDDVIHQLFPLSVLYATERGRSQERERIAKLLDAMPDAVIVVGVGGGVKYANSQALAFYGWEASPDVFPLAIPQKTTEVKIQHALKEKTGEMRVQEIDWQGEPATLITTRDVTEQRKLEIQLLMSDRLAALGTLSASIVHEINNPLLAVLSNINHIARTTQQQEPAAREELNELLTETTEALEQIQQIVRDVKLFSRNEEEPRAVSSVHRVLDSVVRMAHNEIRQRARLHKEYGDIPAVFASSSRLSQVFLNLLINAAQAIPRGKTSENEIRIRTYTKADETIVEIQDSGAGIPLELQKQIFTPFFTTKPTNTGTGLGLAICQRIINGLGGRIWFESKPNQGTRFFVALPSAPGKPRPTPPDPIPAFISSRILIVDDDANITRSLERALRGQHLVTCYNNAAEALAAITQGARFDAIISDMMMPSLNGIDFYHAVSNVAPDQAARFLFITGSASASPFREFFAHTPIPVLEKPFQLPELLAQIKQLR